MASNSWRISLDRRLHDAAKNGNMVLLKELLPRPIQVEGEIAVPVAGEADEAPLQRPRLPARCLLGVTHGGDTVLHIAARFGHLEVATWICHENVSLLMKENAKSETPLHAAARTGRQELVDLFIQRSREDSNVDLGKILTKRNRDGETALYQAVLNNRLHVVKKFLHHANVNQYVSQLVSIPNNENISPLYLAILRQSLDVAGSLIESLSEREDVSRGAYAGPDGQTALHAAALRRQGFVQEVLDWKPELAKSTDSSGSTPLHYAASSGNLEAISAILQENITCAYVADSSGLYPVHVAVKMGFVEVVAELFDLCPDLDELLDKNGRNLVHFAVKEQKEGIVRWICRKPERAKTMNYLDNNGDTAMHLAVKAENIPIFANLLGTKMVNLGVMNKDGLTPFDLAVSKRPVGISHWQNPNLMMLKTLQFFGGPWGINRRDHFASQHRLQYDQKKEKIVESFESMAKNMAIGTVLIASAAFAGAFSVSGAYKADFLAGNTSPGLNFAFKSFLLMIVYAFVCSITATSLLIQAALTYLDPIYRENCILIGSELIIMATDNFVASFAIGVYVVLTPVSKGLASLVCLAGAVVTVLLQPHLCPNFLVTRALIRYFGWRGVFLGYRIVFWRIVSLSIFVYFVVAFSLLPTPGAVRALVLAYGIAISFFSICLLFPRGRWLLSKLLCCCCKV